MTDQQIPPGRKVQAEQVPYGAPAQPALPRRGIPAGQALAEIRALREQDLPTHGGRLFAYVYDPAVPGLDDLANAAYALSAPVNGLDPTAFPSLLEMENALVGAAASRLGGGPGGVETVVGNVTSGGTESLILAVKAARDAHPGIAAPRLVMPVTAHAALAKACAYLRIGLDVVPVDPASLRPSVTDLAAAITPETVLVACSAPGYAHGVVDPVTEIAAVAAQRGVRCHVDACFGGWVLPDLRRLGASVPAFDFSVPGVTSISVDLHKYAYCPKGVSILLHRDSTLRTPQYFAYAGWPGYTMINSTIASTRSGGPIAAAYATLRHIGAEGYLALARSTMEAVAGLSAAVRALPGLRLMSEPAATVVSFTSDDPELDIFVLADELTALGWHTQPQLGYEDLPRNIHLTVTAAIASQADQFGPALATAAQAARAQGPVRLPPELLAAAAALTSTRFTPESVAALASGLGLGQQGPGGPLPERMAVINTLLDAAPPSVREGLLVAFFDLLQQPTWGP